MTLPSHSPMEDFLGRYCGLMLFVKEIDYERYQAICGVSRLFRWKLTRTLTDLLLRLLQAYFAAVGDLHRAEMQAFMAHLKSQLKLPTEEEIDSSQLISFLFETIKD